VGAGVVGSAVGMDKVIFKDVMRAHNLPVTRYVVVRAHQWRDDKASVIRDIIDQLGFPCFAKPANMGSSVGISKIKSAAEISGALIEAFKWDRKVLVEWAVPKARELEVSVLGNERKIASAVGEIVPGREFYDYAAKYLDKGEAASKLIIPAKVPAPLVTLIQETAIEVATISDARGMARVDLLMDGSNNEIYINEINTIPGFTEISMYPKLFAASGLAYPQLLDRLIELAHESAKT
jgi:D-alanine-D-alanine ligase